jgi:hypothetical protein
LPFHFSSRLWHIQMPAPYCLDFLATRIKS